MTSSSEPARLEPPPRTLLWRESRALLDATRMLGRMVRPVRRSVRSWPVVLLPGFGTGSLSLRPLRRFLSRHGLQVEDWGLGVNRAGLDLPHGLEDLGPTWRPAPIARYRGEAGVSFLCDRMVDRVRRRSAVLGSKLNLIGWSLGGTIAREVARDAPECVAHVITLGSPVVGGPKYTAAARLLAQRGLDLDWIETEVARREADPLRVPVTAVLSPTDAIVAYEAALDRNNPHVRHVEMDVPHLGMGVNPAVWDVILDSLSRIDVSGVTG